MSRANWHFIMKIRVLEIYTKQRLPPIHQIIDHKTPYLHH